MKLLGEIISYVLTKDVYPASSAGLEMFCSASKNGLQLSFSGYNEKLNLLVDIVSRKLTTAVDTLEESVFEVLRADLKKDCFNKLVSVESFGRDFFSSVLHLHQWGEYDFYKGIDKISLDDVQKFSQKFFRQSKIQMLVSGNMTKTQAEQIVAMLRENLNPQPLDEPFDLKGQVYKLPEENTVLRVQSLLTNDENSFTQIYYQSGPETVKEKNMLFLLDTILDTQAHDVLRSQDQLGYSVGTSVNDDSDILGFSIHVESQEGKNSNAKVLDKMKTFMMGHARRIISELTDEEFEVFQKAKINDLQAEDLELLSEFTRNWSEIATGDYLFNRIELSVKACKDLTKSELQSFFTELTQQNPRKLTIQVIAGWRFLADNYGDDEKLITDFEAFHNASALYPVVKVKAES